MPAPVGTRPVGASVAARFFVHPYQPNFICTLDSGDVKRSGDGGQTWIVDTSSETQLTRNHQVAISSNDDPSSVGEHFDLILTDMQFDPNNPQLRFAVGVGGASMTSGDVNWTRVLHSGALPGRPSSCYYDSISNPKDPALYVSFAERSLAKISALP